MDLAQQEIKFCTQCKYCKIIELDSGPKVVCMRFKNPTNYTAASWLETRTVFKKINSTACANFVDINDAVSS